MGSIRVCDILDFYECRIKQASMLFVEAFFLFLDDCEYEA